MGFNLDSDVAFVSFGTTPEVLMKGRSSRFQFVMIEGDNRVFDKARLQKHVSWLQGILSVMQDSMTEEEKQKMVQDIVDEAKKVEAEASQVTDTIAAPVVEETNGQSQ